MKKVAIITLAFNKLEEATKPYLKSLYQFTDTDMFDLILVNNGSTDETQKFIENFASDKSNIIIIENSENLWYSKGNNIGIKEIIDKNYEYIGFLNNDILFTPNWLEDTLDAFNLDKSLGMLSPRNNAKSKLKMNNYLDNYKQFLSKFKTQLKYVVTPSFSCVIVKKEVIEKIGGFDEAYSPAFWEDNDLSLRAMYAGYTLAYTNSAFIFHNHSTTSKDVLDDIKKRNQEYFFNKHPLGRWIWEHKRTNLLKDIKKYIIESFE